MAEDVLLHVGLMKSGTTFVQGRLGANTDVLAEQGILFPTPWRRQVKAVVDLADGPGARKGSWEAMVAEVNEHPGRAVISMEFLGPLPAGKIERIREEFNGHVRMVATVRDLGRTVPAMWQEKMQNRGAISFGEYLKMIREGYSDGKTFWRQQGAGRIIDTWARVLGAANCTVITTPPPGAPSTLLWDRFCEVAGIEPADWAEAPRSNESLGAASARLMGRLNERVADLDRGVYNRRVKQGFSKSVLPQRKREEDSIGFQVPPWLAKRSERRSARIADTGVHILGDLAELTPVDVAGGQPDDVSAEAQLEAAIDALARVLSEKG